jgi:hypothetical protein
LRTVLPLSDVIRDSAVQLGLTQQRGFWYMTGAAPARDAPGHGQRQARGARTLHPPSRSYTAMKQVANRTSSLSTIVARTEGYTYAANVWDLFIVQGPVSVAPCQTLIVRFATCGSLYVAGAPTPPVVRCTSLAPLLLLCFAVRRWRSYSSCGSLYVAGAPTPPVLRCTSLAPLLLLCFAVRRWRPYSSATDASPREGLRQARGGHPAVRANPNTRHITLTRRRLPEIAGAREELVQHDGAGHAHHTRARHGGIQAHVHRGEGGTLG